jgi:hypothetical protein
MAKIPKLGRVLAREDYKGGEHYVRVEWVDEEGYRVIGCFKLVGWAQPPRALGEKIMKILSKNEGCGLVLRVTCSTARARVVQNLRRP